MTAGPKARLMLRYPDGQREQIALSTKAKLMVRVTISLYVPYQNYDIWLSIFLYLNWILYIDL